MLLFLVVLNGCGGGGGSSQSSPNSVVTIQIPANQAVTQQVEDATVIVDSGTFTVSTNLVVEQWNANQYAVPNQHGQEVSSGIVLTSSSEPTKDLILRFPVPGQDGDSIAVTKTAGGWEVLVSEVIGQSISVTVPKDSLTRGRSPGQIVGLIGIVFFPRALPTQPTSELVSVAGSGEFAAGRSALIIHGFADWYNDFSLLASRLMQTGRYLNVYSLDYDFTLGGAVAALLLKQELEPYRNRGKVIDIYAHSWGGDVTAYAMEVLGETHVVDNVYFICSPRLGTVHTDTIKVLKFFVNQYLNLSGNEPTYRGLMTLGTPSLQDMAVTSAFIDALKPPSEQRGHVNYHLIGGGLDFIVSFTSATAVGQDIEESTAGTVVRYVDWLAGHNTLVKNSDGIGRLINFINSQQPSNTVELVLMPNPVEAGDNGWNWTIRIRNYSDQTAYLKALTYDSFNMSGNHLGVTWYDPNSLPGTFFPPEYREWGMSLLSHYETYLYIRDVPDRNSYSGLKIWEVPLEMRARSLEHTLTYVINGRPETVATTLTEYYQNLWPTSPNTRSPRQVGVGNNVGQLKAPVIQPIN